MGVIYLQDKCRKECCKMHSSSFAQPGKRAFITAPQPAHRVSQESDGLSSISDSGGHHRENQLRGISKFVVDT